MGTEGQCPRGQPFLSVTLLQREISVMPSEACTGPGDLGEAGVPTPLPSIGAPTPTSSVPENVLPVFPAAHCCQQQELTSLLLATVMIITDVSRRALEVQGKGGKRGRSAFQL